MRVVLGASCARPSGAGTTTYVRGLLESLTLPRNQITVIVQTDAVSLVPDGYIVRAIPESEGTRRAVLNKVVRPEGRLFHSLDIDLPARWDGPTVATVHDLSVFDVPATTSAFRARGERLLLRHMARQADEIIAVSEFTAERLRKVLGRDSVVIPIAPAADMRPPTADECTSRSAPYDLPDRFVLHVGTLEPRKNLYRLATACMVAEIPLVLAGADWEGGVNLAGKVHRLGYVPRADLPALYAASTVTTYVSTYEGFGLPPVEAMACGAPVVCSPVGSLRPLLGEDAAEWVDPRDVRSIAAGLRAVICDKEHRQALIEAGQAASAKLSFEETARQTEAVWAQL